MVATPDRVRDRHYVPGEEKALRRDLLASDRATLFYPVRSVSELLLVEDAQPTARTVSGQFLLSPRALTQVCQFLSPGMGVMLRDLSGADRAPGASASIYSPLEAKKIYNCVLRRRFTHRLSSSNILRTGTLIRAVVGGSYQRLSHVDFLDTVACMAREQGELDFVSAALTAGLLRVRYFRKSIYARHENDEFVAGWQFQNGETGLASASVVALLARRHSLLASRWINTSSRGSAAVRHDASDLPVRLASCFARSMKALWPSERVVAAVGRAKGTLLGLGQRSLDGEERRRTELAASLVYCVGHRSLPAVCARTVLDSAATFGSADEPELFPDRRELARRTAFDLALALGREARTAAPALADRLEAAAREVLTGTFLIPPVKAGG
jgi:hypothetical protein